MIRKEYLIAALLTAAGAAGGYWLLPEDADLARMEVRNFNYSEPEEHYEEKFEQGDRDIESVQQLVRIHTNTGDIDRAIEVLEIYVREHPEDTKALQQLGELYQFAQRYEDYMAILEERAKEGDNAVVLQEMAQLYNFFQEQDKQKETLTRLYIVENGKNTKTLRDLALFAAVDKEYGNVIKWLGELLELDKTAYTQEDAVRHVDALLEEERFDDALTLTKIWYKLPQSKPEGVAKLVDMLHYQGSTSYARQMLDAIGEDEIRKSSELLHSWVLVLMAEGKRDEAYKVLAELHDDGELPDILAPELMHFAVLKGDDELFDELHQKSGYTRTPESQLADIWIIGHNNNHPRLLKTVREHLDASAPDEYPLVRTLALVYERSPKRHDALKEMLSGELSDEYLLKLAMATAEVGDREYARQFIAKLPPLDEMTLVELESLEAIYLAMNDTKAAKQFVEVLKASDRADDLGTIGLRTSAAIGDSNLVKKWYARNEESASPQLIDDLFYTAANHGHLGLALDIAEWQKDSASRREQRRAIADIYTRLGRYEAALALYEQEPIRSERDVKNRVFLLSKLAPQSAKHRAQLEGIARQWFRSSSSRSLKEELVYALLENSGDPSLANPYMKHMADQYGGQWLLVYADTMENAGNIEEATAYRLKAANDPSFSAETKLGLAYALADRGYRNEAQQLLVALAENPQTRVAATEQMVYLWSVHPTEEQLEWLTLRWENAEGEEKARYGELLKGKIPPDMVVDHVKRHPTLMRIPEITQDYLIALADQGRLASEIDVARNYAQKTGNTRPLNYLAQLSYDRGALPQARAAYETAYAIDRTNQETLIGAAITADAQADYAAMKQYFEEYLKASAKEPAAKPLPNLPEAYFAYAENIRRAEPDHLADAQPYYQQAFDHVQKAPTRDAQALSIAAQSAAWTGQHEVSDSIFNYAYKQYPESGVLRADKAALRIAQKRYDDAKVELAAIDTMEASRPNDLAGQLFNVSDTGIAEPPVVLDNGRQLVVRTMPESTAPRYWVSNLRNHRSVSYVTEGYDSVLIVSNTGYQFAVNQAGSGWAVQSMQNPTLDLRSESAQLALRKELLYARMELEEGDVNSATDRLMPLEKTYGEDPQFLGFAASTYFYADQWPAAKNRIEKARKLAPQNADIAKLERDIEREHADRVRADVTLINRGDNSELVTALSGETKVNDNWRMGAIVRNHNVEVANRLQPDGTIQNQSANRQSGEIYGIYSHNAKHYSTLRFFANNDAFGLGADHTFVNFLGSTTVSGRWNEPYHEFVEGIFDNAVRDRIALYHQIKPTPRWQAGLGVSWNNYSIDSQEDVRSTFGLEADVAYALREAHPYIGLGYGLDAEYGIDSELQTTTTGIDYRRFPLRSREIHFGSITLAEDFGPRTYGSVLAGYGFDRLGGHGPAVEGRIQHNIYDDWDVGARAFYGLDSTASASDDISLLNAYLQYRF